MGRTYAPAPSKDQVYDLMAGKTRTGTKGKAKVKKKAKKKPTSFGLAGQAAEMMKKARQRQRDAID